MSDYEVVKERIFDYLKGKYKRLLISKYEFAAEMGIGRSTLDLYMAKGVGLPSYKKLGDAKNARVVFNVIDVAEFLASTVKIFERGWYYAAR